MKLLANLTGFIGNLVARGTSGACWWSFFDEEEMPESLLK